MGKIKTVVLLCCACLILGIIAVSCSSDSTRYVIGVSQCSEDSWRYKLQDELHMATYFNEGVELRITSAHNDSKLQEQQIDSLLHSGIDLLIVSPNQVDNLTDAIGKVRKAGVPVILYDRKISKKSGLDYYFMGADNYLIGEMLGRYTVSRLNGKGNIVEIGGLKGSSPAQERHDGFMDVIKKYPDIKVLGYQSGDWTEASGEIAMRRLIKDVHVPIDVVYGGNDRMAVGARRVLREQGLDNGNILYLGVDALPTNNGGMQQVADSILTASAIYPTHGDELLQLAIRILNGETVPEETMFKSSIVTSANAKVLLLQHEEVERQAAYLKKMHDNAGIMHESIRNQRLVIGVILTLIFIAVILLGLAIRGYQVKHQLNEVLRNKNGELEQKQKELSGANAKLSALNTELKKKNDELSYEKEIAERQRDELEEQRDKIIEMSLNQQTEEQPSEDDVLNGNEKHFRRENEFLNKFIAAINDQLSNSDLSVEDIGSEMCLSRVQLYRKVKALTGKSPVEIIREERLRRGHQLLADSSLTISEIAYRVGFSSPSYFTKCYKDMFGKSPTDVQKM